VQAIGRRQDGRHWVAVVVLTDHNRGQGLGRRRGEEAGTAALATAARRAPGAKHRPEKIGGLTRGCHRPSLGRARGRWGRVSESDVVEVSGGTAAEAQATLPQWTGVAVPRGTEEVVAGGSGGARGAAWRRGGLAPGAGRLCEPLAAHTAVQGDVGPRAARVQRPGRIVRTGAGGRFGVARRLLL